MKPKATPEMFSDEELQQVIDDISPILSKLPPGMTILAETLYPRAIWKSFNKYVRSLIGQQLVHLVKIRKIRLQFPKDGDEAVQRYIVI